MDPALTPKRAMVNTAAVLFVLGLAWVLIRIRSIIILLVLSIIFAAAIEPLVNRLRRRGLARGQAIIAVFAALLAVLAVIVYLAVPPLARQSTALIDGIPRILDTLHAQAAGSDSEFFRTTGARTIEKAKAAYLDLRQDPPIAGTTAVGYVFSLVGGLFTTVTAMIIAFYWLTEKAIIKRVVLGLFPLDRRDRVHALWDEIEHRIGGWTRGQLLLMLFIGSISTVAYFAMGLPFWLSLGLFAGLTEAIPFIGPFLGGGAAFVVALTDSWQKALLVAVFALILQQIEGAILVPRVMRNAVGLTPLTVVLAVLIGGALYGPLGSILAIPIAAAIQVLIQDLLGERAVAPDPDTGGQPARRPRPGRAEAVSAATGLVPDGDGPA